MLTGFQKVLTINYYYYINIKLSVYVKYYFLLVNHIRKIIGKTAVSTRSVKKHNEVIIPYIFKQT